MDNAFNDQHTALDCRYELIPITADTECKAFVIILFVRFKVTKLLIL